MTLKNDSDLDDLLKKCRQKIVQIEKDLCFFSYRITKKGKLHQDLENKILLCGLAIASEREFPLDFLQDYIVQFPLVMKMIHKNRFFIFWIKESLEGLIIENVLYFLPIT